MQEGSCGACVQWEYFRHLLAVCVQVIVDAPRTAPHVPFFHFASVQKSLERLLYIWGNR
jgi:hypothetical protein